ncbi:MAG TPA: glycosyltransferase family 2 protein [Terriglobia bacterium]|nr:glycosyltransferase family 2 protein [Terriglobia bacterium]
MTPEAENKPSAQDSQSARENARPMLLSVIVPCANEEEVLRETHRRLSNALNLIGMAFEILYVDDGSTDSTMKLLRELQESDSQVRVVCLSRNFGHQLAITAGMEHAAGDALVVIDADLQDPPEVIAEFVERWRAGYDVAYGVRTEREGETAFKLWTAKVFYRLIGRLSDTKISVDSGDFRLLDRKVAGALLAMPERDRFIRGMVSWLGFSQVAVPYRRAARLAGKTKYPLFKMVRFAADGIVSFSTTPLRMATWFGFIVSALAVLGIFFALYARLFEKDWVKGWASTLIPVLFLGGVQLICLGIIGEYVGRIYGESKRRPLYLVQERLGFAVQPREHEPAPGVKNSVEAFDRTNFRRPRPLPVSAERKSNVPGNQGDHGDAAHPIQTSPKEKLKL